MIALAPQLPNPLSHLCLRRRIANHLLDILRDHAGVGKDHRQPILVELHRGSKFVNACIVGTIAAHRREMLTERKPDDELLARLERA